VLVLSWPCYELFHFNFVSSARSFVRWRWLLHGRLLHLHSLFVPYCFIYSHVLHDTMSSRLFVSLSRLASLIILFILFILYWWKRRCGGCKTTAASSRTPLSTHFVFIDSVDYILDHILGSFWTTFPSIHSFGISRVGCSCRTIFVALSSLSFLFSLRFTWSRGRLLFSKWGENCNKQLFPHFTCKH